MYTNFYTQIFFDISLTILKNFLMHLIPAYNVLSSVSQNDLSLLEAHKLCQLTVPTAFDLSAEYM